MEDTEDDNNLQCSHKDKRQELHTCPFKEEINDDHESLCSCCEACTRECAMDV